MITSTETRVLLELCRWGGPRSREARTAGQIDELIYQERWTEARRLALTAQERQVIPGHLLRSWGTLLKKLGECK